MSTGRRFTAANCTSNRTEIINIKVSSGFVVISIRSKLIYFYDSKPFSSLSFPNIVLPLQPWPICSDSNNRLPVPEVQSWSACLYVTIPVCDQSHRGVSNCAVILPIRSSATLCSRIRLHLMKSKLLLPCFVRPSVYRAIGMCAKTYCRYNGKS